MKNWSLPKPRMDMKLSEIIITIDRQQKGKGQASFHALGNILLETCNHQNFVAKIAANFSLLRISTLFQIFPTFFLKQ